MRLNELFNEVSSLLRESGYRVERISYPSEHRRRSIDLVAVNVDSGRSLLVKVVSDVEDLSGSDYRELHSCSQVLGTAGLVVAEKEGGEEIDPMVAIEKGGTYAVSVEGLRAVLEGGVYVIKRQSNFYMKVDGERLREERLRRGYSLGDVAARASVSRRSIYLYEQEESLVSLNVALRLMELFGEEIFKPFDVIGEQERGSRDRVFAAISQSSSKTQVARILASMGYSVAATKRIPPDVVAGREEAGTRRRIVIVTERKRDVEFERRVEEAEKIARSLRARVIAYSRRHRELGGVETLSSIEELRELLSEE